jgi:hypothetical protein
MNRSANPKLATFILTHGRPDNVVTLKTLQRSGYTGDVFLLIDNEDKRGAEYRVRFPDIKVIEFDKAHEATLFDTADNRSDRRTIVFARNASQRIARELGYDYLFQLDDDYTSFLYRYREGNTIHSKQIRQMDAVLNAMVEFLNVSGAATVAMSQGGDHMGGVGGNIGQGLRRKAMNSFVIDLRKPIGFFGRLNEDVNTYVVDGNRGRLFFTIMALQLNQLQTQRNAGGMSEVYLASGTYVKSFYTVMAAPSCVSISTMGRTDRRFHHSIRWNNAVPKIISDHYRKA